MNTMIILSLLLNIGVLTPVCVSLMVQAGWTQASYGEATPARSILLSIYLSILVASAVMLVIRDPRTIATLLTIQIIYKMSTPFTVGTFHNPVVLSNIGIAGFHIVTLMVIWRAIGNPFRN